MVSHSKRTYIFCVQNRTSLSNKLSLKAVKCEIQKPWTFRSTLFRCKFWVDVSRFSPCVINLSRNKNCCRLKKVVAISRAQFYFEQQILAFLLVFHQRNSQLVFSPHPENQPISSLHFLNSQEMFLLRDKSITQGEKREASTQNLQRNNVARLRAFISRI